QNFRASRGRWAAARSSDVAITLRITTLTDASGVHYTVTPVMGADGDGISPPQLIYDTSVNPHGFASVDVNGDGKGDSSQNYFQKKACARRSKSARMWCGHAGTGCENRGCLILRTLCSSCRGIRARPYCCLRARALVSLVF